MRFFSSSAFASAEKLRFAANCSAAETIFFGFLPPPSRCPASVGRSIQPDAGHYLVLGFDMSLILSCRMTQMLRRFAFVLFGRSQNLHRAARLLDRGDSGNGCDMDLDVQLGLEFTPAEQPHAVLGAPVHPRFLQRGGSDGFLGVELLAIDRLLIPIE